MTLIRHDDRSVRKCVRHDACRTLEKERSFLPSSNSHHSQHLRVSVVWEVCGMMTAIIRFRRHSSLVWGVFLAFLFLLYISLSMNTPSPEPCLCSHQANSLPHLTLPRPHPQDKHKMAILIPFRDRFEELQEFAPYIHKFLNKQRKNHHIYVINQVDNFRFNRASLLNVGFLESSDDCDYIAMHDVDLLPLNPEVKYVFPAEGPYHVAAPHLHPRYHYPTFCGGILLVNRKHFQQVDGLSNKYWGWGLEDDEFYARLKEAYLEISRPGNLTTGMKDTFRHVHDQRRRRRDMIKCYNQHVVLRLRDRQTGLSTLKYTIHSRREMTIDGAPITILNTVLGCDRSITPWCDCIENVGNTPRPKQKPRRTEDVIAPLLNRKGHITADG